MAVTVGSIGTTSPEPAGKKLNTTVVTTTEGSVHNEGVFAADPEDAAARANVRNATPGGTDYGVVTRPITASLPLPAGASTEATLATRLSESDFDTKIGSLTEAAPATDTASSGLNGRLQRIAQRLSSLIALLPAALVGGRFDSNLGAWLGSTAPTVGSKTSANSVPVVVASDQGAVAVSSAGLTNLDVALSTRLKPADTLAAVTAITNVVHVDDNAASLTVDAPVGTPVFVRLSDGAAALVGQKTMAASSPVVLASDQASVPVVATGPTLTKGTQGATGFSVQNLVDAGRVNICWTAEFAFAQTAETLLTITESRDGAATSTFTTKVVTSGKRLRITSIALEVETLGTGTTVPQRGYLRMRFNTAGAVTTASPLQFVGGVGAQPPAILKTAGWGAWSFPDGIEFLGDGTKQIGFTLETPDWVVTTQTGRAKVTITAFEY